MCSSDLGAGALLIIAPLASAPANVSSLLCWLLVAGVVAHLLITAIEFGGRHQTRNAEMAAHSITHGRYARTFWLGSVVLSAIGGVLAAVGAVSGLAIAAVIAGVIVQPALLLHEKVFVKAAQDPPLS